ncbi:MAG: response regulator [Oscillospiraceae bacterium]|jgi:putative two-component system response regulator|nr:response regulator [Oscillospiraceae bacterium]
MTGQKHSIFLVDDNIVNLNMGKTILQNKYTVFTIPSGEKLMASLTNLKPDLILLDIDMPEISGYDVIKMLKCNPETADIPVIFLTGKSNSDDELLGLSLGAIDYITKPFSQSILLKRVELHMLLQAQKLELRELNNNLLDKVNERTDEILALQNAVIMWAAEFIEFRDEETGQHVDRVQNYIKVLLGEMKKTELYADEIATWDIGAFLRSTSLHDVGKIKIRDDILLKPGPLTSEEFDNMRLHTVYGKMLLESLQNKVPNQMFLEYAKVLAYNHHERWDGKGYPDNLEGENIPLQARMMALADVYDALISERPYKKALSHEEAVTVVANGRGTQFDPNLSDLFVSLSGKIKAISEKLLA